jgi:hypothetical protein
MAWFQDLAEFDCVPYERPSLRAVGWLQRGKPFPVGAMQPDLYAALTETAKDPWQPCLCMGWHTCDLCLSDSPATGYRNIFIPGDGVIYSCPELITHYIDAHGYQPPECFCEAVLRCPPMGSMEYLQALVVNGGRDLVKAANPALVQGRWKTGHTTVGTMNSTIICAVRGTEQRAGGGGEAARPVSHLSAEGPIPSANATCLAP